MVIEFWTVFPNDLPIMPTNRDIEFCIDFDPETHPISVPSYCMSSAKLREGKNQLHELLDKGFFHP